MAHGAASVKGCSLTPIHGADSAEGVVGIRWPMLDALAETPQPRSSRVLIVEDDDDVALNLKHGLEINGYRVALAHNGPVALTVAREFAPDVVLLDIGLPVMDGHELALRLREQRPGVVFVAVTARVDEADQRRSAEVGCVAHLPKPHVLADLLQVLEAISFGIDVV